MEQANTVSNFAYPQRVQPKGGRWPPKNLQTPIPPQKIPSLDSPQDTWLKDELDENKITKLYKSYKNYYETQNKFYKQINLQIFARKYTKFAKN